MKIRSSRMQGSTYKQAIINCKDINCCQDVTERKRLFYTGVTRASDLLIIYNI